MRGARGQHEQAVQLLLLRPRLDVLHQLVAVAAAAVLGHHGQTGHLGRLLAAEGIERGTADDDAIVIEDREAADLHLDAFAAALDQGAVGLQRTDQGEYRADVVDRRLAQMRQRRLGHHRTDAGAGEKLHQHGPVGSAVDEMHPTDTAAAGAQCARQHPRQLRRLLDPAGEEALGIVRGDRLDQCALLVDQAWRLAKEDQLVRLERSGDRFGHLLPGKVEDLAGGRDAERRDQHHILLIEIGADLLGIDLAHGAGVLEVDAADHADRLGGDEVAAGDAHPGAGHRRVRQALGKQGLDLDAGHAHRALDAFQGGAVGYPQALMEMRLQTAPLQLGIDLRTRAMNQHQAYSQAFEQVEILRQRLGGFGPALEHLATEGDDEGAATKGIDVGRGLAHPGHQSRADVCDVPLCRHAHSLVDVAAILSVLAP